MMKNFKNIIFIFFGLLILSIIISFFSPTFLESLRIVFGGFYILFIPGFTIVYFFFKDTNIIEKITLSFALSIAIIPLIIFYLNFFFKLKITALNVTIVILVIMLVTYIIYKLTKDKQRKYLKGL